MALAASLNVNLGTAAGRTFVMGSATVDIVFLPSDSSDVSRVLNSSRGKSRKSAAMRSSGSTLAATLGGFPSERASRASTAWFSCSILLPSWSRGFRERLGIGTLHSRPQGGECSKLQLLHRTLGPANPLRHLLNTFLLDEAQHHNPPLFERQRLDETKQRGAPFNFFNLDRTDVRQVDPLGLIVDWLPASALPAIGDQIGCDSEQPCCKRNSPPLESLQVSQGVVKHLRGQISGFSAICHPAHDVGIYALEVVLIKLGKAGGILLCRLDQKPLVRFFLQSLQPVLRAVLITLRVTVGREEKLRWDSTRFRLRREGSPRGASSEVKCLPIGAKGFGYYVRGSAKEDSRFSSPFSAVMRLAREVPIVELALAHPRSRSSPFPSGDAFRGKRLVGRRHGPGIGRFQPNAVDALRFLNQFVGGVGAFSCHHRPRSQGKAQRIRLVIEIEGYFPGHVTSPLSPNFRLATANFDE